eukprot:TRINITY_DN33075_c0_g1_i1.p1 TRINITY_DN33075_c0_g1~~TRINITY_DN33075_c0_g1_i1.p1  ORF type:complete len:714 (+),score=62.25 TRINITY_DN33075_c0_g1_i1:199-2142(+)
MSITDVRRRALTLVDVVSESQAVGPLRMHRFAVALAISWAYWRYVLPMVSSWGVGRWSTEVRLGFEQARSGGPASAVHGSVVMAVTLTYLYIVFFGVRFMERRPPVEKRIFEWMIVYNATQALLNLRLACALLYEVWQLGYTKPWGNELDGSERAHGLGMLIYLQYHCRQLDLLDTVFMILRKKFQRISFVHVYLRLLNLWGWFLVCRFACGGDSYFPAMVNATCQVIVYLYYTVHLVFPKGVPCFRRGRVAEVQVAQFMLCGVHAVYVLMSGNLPPYIAIYNLFVMANCLVFYFDFDSGHSRLGLRRTLKTKDEGFGHDRVTFCFDSSGWLYCYHFGVAMWLAEHVLPKDLKAGDAESDKYPKGVAFSGASGGALVAATLGSGINVRDLFEYVLSRHDACRRNPFKIFPALEDALDKFLPENAAKSLSGRVRILLTRVSTTAPFVTGEIVDQFRDWREAWRTLRASCHVPGLFWLPYKVNDRFYFDGLLWTSFFVPWVSDNSITIRVSAICRPLSEMKAPLHPLWWAMFPPPNDVLRGMLWTGYRDAARWFSTRTTGPLDLCKCRRIDAASEDELASSPARSNNKRAAQDLLLKKPPQEEFPQIDPVTGQDVAELIEIYHKAAERNLICFSIFVAVVLLASFAAAF